MSKLSPFKLGPAFVSYTRKPLTSALIVSVMRAALASAPDIDV